MPPRYAYWTILVDNQPTAFRAGAAEELRPTFNRLKQRNPSAVMMWFQYGTLWRSPFEAREHMAQRGAEGRRQDPRQGGGRTLKPSRLHAPTPSNRPRPRLEWKPRPSARQSQEPKAESRPPLPGAPPRKPRAPRAQPKPGSKNWRPGGDHQDPRQKYIDAKKAKWTRFKKAIRDRHDKKSKP